MAAFRAATTVALCASALCATLAVTPPDAALIDEGTQFGEHCEGGDVNDAGTVVGQRLAHKKRVAFVAASVGGMSALAPLVRNENCFASGIDNVVIASSRIFGTCNSSFRTLQGVYWSAVTPTVAPVLLKPLAGLLVASVQSDPVAMNLQGDMAGHQHRRQRHRVARGPAARLFGHCDSAAAASVGQ